MLRKHASPSLLNTLILVMWCHIVSILLHCYYYSLIIFFLKPSYWWLYFSFTCKLTMDLFIVLFFFFAGCNKRHSFGSGRPWEDLPMDQWVVQSGDQGKCLAGAQQETRVCARPGTNAVALLWHHCCPVTGMTHVPSSADVYHLVFLIIMFAVVWPWC